VVNRATHKHEIVAISVLTHGGVNIEGDTKDPEKQVCNGPIRSHRYTVYYVILEWAVWFGRCGDSVIEAILFYIILCVEEKMSTLIPIRSYRYTVTM
jgi:hypothetical protein